MYLLAVVLAYYPPFLAAELGRSTLERGMSSGKIPPYPPPRSANAGNEPDREQYYSQLNKHQELHDAAWAKSLKVFYSILIAGFILAVALLFCLPRDGKAFVPKCAIAGSFLLYAIFGYVAFIGYAFRDG
jgi:hypothetical protein